MRTVLSIAGSDSGGGAGIQADAKAFSRIGVYGTFAITAVTAQNTVGVRAVHAVPAAMIAAQVQAVVEDIGVDAVKVGMLGDAATAAAVGACLAQLPDRVPVVVDPVLVATSGAELLEPAALAELCTSVIPRATVLTPNLEEARALAREAGEEAVGEHSAAELAAAVRRLGAQFVVVTGGHADQIVDLFWDGVSAVEIAGERETSQASHGSGCTHSAALAALLALGEDPLTAARQAHALAAAAVRDGVAELGRGAGPVNILDEPR